MYIYKSTFNEGYLTCDGEVILERVEKFISKVSEYEVIFMNNRQVLKNKKRFNWKDYVWRKFLDNKECSYQNEKKLLFEDIDKILENEAKNDKSESNRVSNPNNLTNELLVDSERFYFAIQSLEKVFSRFISLIQII